MTPEVRTQPGRLFLLTLFTAATVLASVEQVGAHAGNTSPSVIHACVNRTNGNTRIVGLTGSCSSAEDASHWGIVGPQGPQGPAGPAGPAGVVASFDSLAGLACTLNGAVGMVAILYADNGDATLRCVVSQPPPPPASGISGTYDVSPTIQYNCLFVAGFTVTDFVFAAAGNLHRGRRGALLHGPGLPESHWHAYSVTIQRTRDGTSAEAHPRRSMPGTRRDVQRPGRSAMRSCTRALKTQGGTRAGTPRSHRLDVELNRQQPQRLASLDLNGTLPSPWMGPMDRTLLSGLLATSLELLLGARSMAPRSPLGVPTSDGIL
jgi:hypothetical protein